LLIGDLHSWEAVPVVRDEVLDVRIGVQFSVADFQNGTDILDSDVREGFLLRATVIAVRHQL
jgi:hypothetical protein